mmetsp:Transcript_26529/g.63161  ORF Transcript_26529/g.63161 Transcript_26529/m.63161 type:complete len:612 (+) Transcript_26529:164-1999(+)
MIRSLRNTEHPSNQTSHLAVKMMEMKKMKELIRLLKDDDNVSGVDDDMAPPLTVLDLRDIQIGNDRHRRQRRQSKDCSVSPTADEEETTTLFHDLLGVLKRNKTVKAVNIVLRCFENMLTDDELIELFQTIGSMKQLEVLWVGSSGLAGHALRCITEALKCGQSRLKSLSLQSIHFRNAVKYCPRTETGLPTWYSTKDPVFHEFCQVLSSLDNLESLSLDSVEETFDLNSIVIDVVPSLTSLQKLHLMSYKYLEDARLSEKSLSVLSSSSTIKSLAMNRLQLSKSLPGFLTSLEHNHVLEILNLDSNQMRQEGGAALAYLIRFNKTLQKLRVGNNLLGDECGQLIVRSLEHNTTLKLLNLHSNFLGQQTVDSLADLLASNNCRLEVLNLGSNVLGDSAGIKLSSALTSKNNGLKSLMLARTNITHATCAVFSATLKSKCCKLERLDISGNNLGHDGWLHFADALKVNKSLKNLNLRSTKLINDKAPIALFKALEDNTALESVNLMNTVMFTPISCQAVEGMMSKNTSLIHLWLPTTDHPILAVDLYIKLNRAGRRKLMKEQENTKLWSKAMYELKDDIRALYHLLQLNPNILELIYNNEKQPGSKPIATAI